METGEKDDLRIVQNVSNLGIGVHHGLQLGIVQNHTVHHLRVVEQTLHHGRVEHLLNHFRILHELILELA